MTTTLTLVAIVPPEIRLGKIVEVGTNQAAAFPFSSNRLISRPNFIMMSKWVMSMKWNTSQHVIKKSK